MSEEETNGNSWIGSSSRKRWIREFELFCGSNDLSIDGLRRITPRYTTTRL